MLCLQRVERLTLEGNSFKVPGKGWLFQLGMKREMRCWKSDQTLELMWDCTRTSGSGFVLWAEGFFLHNDDLKFVTSAGVPALFPMFWPWNGWIPAVSPLRCSASGDPGRVDKLWQNPLPFHSFCTWDTNTVSEKTLMGGVESRWCRFKVMRHLRNYTPKQFYCPAWPFKKKI